MLVTLLAVALAFPAVAVQADEALSLVQASAKVLPEVHQVMQGPKKVFAKLSGQVGSLTEKLQQEQQKAKKTTSDMKAAY